MSKKIEPTVAMILEAASTGTPLGTDARAILRAALNHPDARGLFADEDAIRAAREEGWDEAAGWGYRTATLGHQASKRIKDANPYRPTQELPTEDGAVIVPAEGREFIEAEVSGRTYIAREAVVCQTDFGPANVLEGAWRRGDDGSRAGGQMARHCITPGTWQVADQ